MILNQKKNPNMDRLMKLSFRDHVGTLSPTRSPVSSPVPIIRQSSNGGGGGSGSLNSSSSMLVGIESKEPLTPSSAAIASMPFERDDPTAEMTSLRRDYENLKMKHQLLQKKNQDLENRNNELQKRVAELEVKTSEFKELQQRYTKLVTLQKAENHYSLGSTSPSSSTDELSLLDVMDSLAPTPSNSSNHASSGLIANHHNVSVVRQHLSPDGGEYSAAPVSTTPLGKKHMICRHYLKGRCRYKVNCKFSHDLKYCPHCNAGLERDPDLAAEHLANCWDRLHPSDK
jgi:hypothetical protein